MTIEKQPVSFEFGASVDDALSITDAHVKDIILQDDVQGKGLSPDLLRCYRGIIGTWQLPATGEPYRVMFRRVH